MRSATTTVTCIMATTALISLQAIATGFQMTSMLRPLTTTTALGYISQQSMKTSPQRAISEPYHYRLSWPLESTTSSTTVELPESTPVVDVDDVVSSETSSEVQKRAIAIPKISSDGTIAKSAAATFATILTYSINNALNLGPVMGSSVVAILTAVLLGPTRPVLQLAALCGSFAGMARSPVIPSPAAAIILGLACSYFIDLFDKKKWLVGKGGRLGFIAQCACTSTFCTLRYGIPMLPVLLRKAAQSTIGSVVAPAALTNFGLYKTLSLSRTMLTDLPLSIFYVTTGAFFMRAWKFIAAKVPSVGDRLATPTAAVGATGLLASLTLPATVAGPAFVGSFVAMSAPTVLPGRMALFLASALAAFSQVALTGVMLGGWGGKMGTSAALGVLTYGLLGRLSKGKDDVKSE